MCRRASSESPPTTTTRPPASSRTAASWRRRRKSASRARSTTRRFRRRRSRTACARPASPRRSSIYVGFYEKPLVKFERLLETYVACAPRGWRSYLMAMPLWLEREAVDGRRHRAITSRATKARCCSASTTNRTPRRRSIRRRSSRRPSSRWTASASGRPRRSASAAATTLEMLQRAALSALARPAVFGVHLLRRLQGQLRRIQGDGPRAVRRAEVREDHQGSPASRFATMAACG